MIDKDDDYCRQYFVIKFKLIKLTTPVLTGEVLVRLSKHQGRANALKTLNEGVKCLRKYIAEYNVLNLAKEKDPRESPLPRDNKGLF